MVACMASVACYLARCWWCLFLVEVVDVVGGLAVDVALADPPAGVLVAGPHLAPAPRPALPVAHVAVVVPRTRPRQEAEHRAKEGEGRLPSHPSYLHTKLSLLPSERNLLAKIREA